MSTSLGGGDIPRRKPTTPLHAREHRAALPPRPVSMARTKCLPTFANCWDRVQGMATPVAWGAERNTISLSD